MNRKNKIWSLNKAELTELVNKFNTLSDIIRNLGMTVKGTSNFTSLKKKLIAENIDFSHIKLGLSNKNGKKYLNAPKQPIENFLVENSRSSRSYLKKRLIKEGLLEYKCKECGLKEWQGKYISLQLDHINGVFDDNRFSNLRLICPNCHSQTHNYAGKGKHFTSCF